MGDDGQVREADEWDILTEEHRRANVTLNGVELGRMPVKQAFELAAQAWRGQGEDVLTMSADGDNGRRALVFPPPLVVGIDIDMDDVDDMEVLGDITAFVSRFVPLLVKPKPRREQIQRRIQRARNGYRRRG